MEASVLGLILDSSIIVEAERKGHTVEQFLHDVKENKSLAKSQRSQRNPATDLRTSSGGRRCWFPARPEVAGEARDDGFPIFPVELDQFPMMPATRDISCSSVMSGNMPERG